MKDLARTLGRYFPWLLGFRVRAIVWYRLLTYPLRFIPVSSKYFGPPKGIYKNLRHYSRHPASRQSLTFIPLSRRKSGLRKLPPTNSRSVERRFSEMKRYRVFESSVGILRRGRVWGKDGGVVITPNDRIIRELSPVNYTFRMDLHHAFAKVKLPRVRRYRRIVHLITWCAESNFWHWTYDLLPRLDLVARAGIDLTDAHYLINHRNLSYQMEGLKRLGIPMDKVIMADETVHVEADELVVPSLLNINLDTDSFAYSAETYRFLRNTFLEKPGEGEEEARPRVFVSREKSRRKAPNEDCLFAALREYGFEKFVLEDHSLAEQARLFASAEFVVAFHGAGLANLAFCRPGTRVIEIFLPDFIVSNFWTVSEQLGLSYHTYCEDERHLGVMGQRYRRELIQEISVEQFMCFFKRVQHDAPPAARETAKSWPGPAGREAAPMQALALA